MATRPLVDNTTPASLPAADRLQLAEELLDLAERAQTHARASGSAIALKLGEKLYVRTSSGIAPEVGSSLTIGEGAIGQCARLGKPCNVSEEDKIEPSLRALGVRSLIGVPIHHAGIFYGVLVALAQAPEAFTRMQVAIMMTMGNEVARVIKRMEPAAMEIAPGTPLQSTPAAVAVPDDNVVEISLTPTAKQEIVETIKAIEQKPAVPPAAPMKLMIDTPVTPKPAPQPSAPMVQAAPVVAVAKPTVAVTPSEMDVPKPLPELLPPGEDPRRYGTLKTAKSLEPKPAFVAANAFAQPRQTSSMKAPFIAAAVVVVALAGFVIWRHEQSSAAPPQIVAAAEPAVATPGPTPVAGVSAPAPDVAKPIVTTPTTPVAAAKSEPVKKLADERPEQPKVVSEQPALHIAAPAKHTEAAPVEAPKLVLASNSALPDLGTPKVPAASLLVKHTTAVPPTVLRQVAPVYPELARRAGVFGNVKLQITVSATGAASSVRAVEGPTLLRAAATDAVSRWQYRAAILDGKPVESTIEVTVKFSKP